MAKKEKAAKAEKVEKATSEFKYGVSDIADELGINEASVRVKLRNKGIEKSGKSYGWNSKSELKEVISQITTPASKDDEDEDETPKKAKKSKAKKAKAKKAKKAKDEEDEDEDD